MFLKFNEISSFNFAMVQINSLKPGTITWKHDSGGQKQQFCTSHVLNHTYNSIIDISYFMYGEKPHQKHCKPHGIPNAHNHPVKHQRYLAQPEDDDCKSKHVALPLHSIVVVLTVIYSNEVNDSGRLKQKHKMEL